jgi:hypothetical protein
MLQRNDTGLFETAARQARVPEQPATPVERVDESVAQEMTPRFAPGNLEVPAFLRRK